MQERLLFCFHQYSQQHCTFCLCNNIKDALNYFASSVTKPSSSRWYSHRVVANKDCQISLIVVAIFWKSSSNANAFKPRQVVNSRQVRELNTAFGRDRELVEKLAGQVWACSWALNHWWWWHWNLLWQYEWQLVDKLPSQINSGMLILVKPSKMLLTLDPGGLPRALRWERSNCGAPRDGRATSWGPSPPPPHPQVGGIIGLAVWLWK